MCSHRLLLAHSPAYCSPSSFASRQRLERWTGRSVCELRRQAAHSHIQTSDVCSTLTSRGHSLPLQPPLPLLISAAFSAVLSNFLLKACLLGNVSHSKGILGLCNTLIYARTLSLFFFFRVGFCVWKRLYIFILKRPYPDSWPKTILNGLGRLDFFIWLKFVSACFQATEHKRFTGSESVSDDLWTGGRSLITSVYLYNWQSCKFELLAKFKCWEEG